MIQARQTRVAVLDDDRSVRTAIGRLLNASDMIAESFGSSVEFLTSLETRSPDCLVLDLQMPGMNGLDVLHYLHQSAASMPVIVITAHDGPGSRQECLSAGATAYLSKPLDAGELLAAITTATQSA